MSLHGLIQYITTTATPTRSPYHYASFYDAALHPWADSLAAGDTQSIYIDWGYHVLEPTRFDARSVNVTPIGFSEVISHGFRHGHKFILDFVPRIRSVGYSDDYEVLNALNDHLNSGTVTWWPDYDNFPTESFTVVANKVIAPKRNGHLHWFTFEFDFVELSLGQAPSSVPAFV